MRKLAIKSYDLREIQVQIRLIYGICVSYILGSSLNDLALKYGVSYGCIRKILIDNNVKLRDKGKQRKDV